MSTILIRPETIVTMYDVGGVLRGREILIEGCSIAAIGQDLESRLEAGSYQVIDAEGMIAIPGLVNAHVHMWQTVLRGLGVDWSAAEHHLHTQTEIVPVVSPEDMLAAELFGALNLLNGGTTTVYGSQSRRGCRLICDAGERGHCHRARGAREARGGMIAGSGRRRQHRPVAQSRRRDRPFDWISALGVTPYRTGP